MIHSIVEETHNHYKITIPPTIGKYNVVRPIGKGGYAVVVLATDTKTNNKVAIKIVSREEIVRHNLLLYLENELRICARLDHPNIAKIHEVIYQPETIMIVMDYYVNGDMQSLLDSCYHFTPRDQHQIASELLEALTYLHKRGIAHRDIKPSNILFDNEFHLKLIDFGLSKQKIDLMATFCGTPLFMAPEVVLSTEYDGFKADIWSFGVVIHLLCSGVFPFDATSEVQFLNDIHRSKLKIILDVPGFLNNIVKNSLIMDPKDRLTAEELLKMIKETENKLQMPMTTIPNYSQSVKCILPKLQVRMDSPNKITKILRKPNNANSLQFQRSRRLYSI